VVAGAEFLVGGVGAGSDCPLFDVEQATTPIAATIAVTWVIGRITSILLLAAGIVEHFFDPRTDGDHGFRNAEAAGATEKM